MTGTEFPFFLVVGEQYLVPSGPKEGPLMGLHVKPCPGGAHVMDEQIGFRAFCKRASLVRDDLEVRVREVINKASKRLMFPNNRPCFAT